MISCLPRGRERDRPVGIGINANLLGHVVKLAVTESTQDGIATTTQHCKIEKTVIVDIKRIRTRHESEIGDRRRLDDEAQGTADSALVHVQSRRALTASEIEIGESVVVAVKCCDTTTYEKWKLSVVCMGDSRRGGLI